MHSLEKLFSKQEINREARERFEEGTGLRFGIVFGIILVLMGWGWDAFELQQASADLYWPKLLLAVVTLIPLSAAAGLIAGHVHRSNLPKFIVWATGGALTGLIAMHLPFEGASAIAALVDPATHGVMLFPFPPAAADRLAGAAAFGALAGLVAVPLQNLATAWAWDRSSIANRITLDGWAMLLACAPLAIALGALYDGSANAPIRGPFELTQRRINIALTTPPDLDLHAMDAARVIEYVSISQWRSAFSPRYVQYMANLDRQAMKEAYIDAAFDNNFIWRCQSVRSASDLLGCADLAETYRGFMRQFLQTGSVQCDNCSVHIEADAAAWRAQMRGKLDDSKPISVIHHAGGVVLVRASLDAGSQVECRFVGADLVEILDCASP